jgi:hypothetical protein
MPSHRLLLRTSTSHPAFPITALWQTLNWRCDLTAIYLATARLEISFQYCRFANAEAANLDNGNSRCACPRATPHTLDSRCLAKQEDTLIYLVTLAGYDYNALSARAPRYRSLCRPLRPTVMV